jgi:hypothetical protein
MKVKTKQGETILSPGQIISLTPSKAESLLSQGRIKQANIEEILDSILKESMDKIIEAHEGRQYHATDEIRASEDEIDRLYKAVLSGQGSLSDFQNAVNIWERRAIENVRK